MTGAGWHEIADEGSGRVWGDPRLARWDYEYADEPGWTAGESQLLAPSGERFSFRFHSGTFLWIEMPEDAAAALGQLPRYWRQLGFGRLRKDLTVPLMPDADRVWVQSALDDAVLVMRPHATPAPAFFMVGPLGEGARRMAAGPGFLMVLVAVGDGLLPNPTMRGLDAAAQDRRAWGGQVACTAAG